MLNLVAALTHNPVQSPNSSLLLTTADAVQRLPLNDFQPGLLERILDQTLEGEGELVTGIKRAAQKDLLVRWPLWLDG